MGGVVGLAEDAALYLGGWGVSGEWGGERGEGKGREGKEGRGGTLRRSRRRVGDGAIVGGG